MRFPSLMKLLQSKSGTQQQNANPQAFQSMPMMGSAQKMPFSFGNFGQQGMAPQSTMQIGQPELQGQAQSQMMPQNPAQPGTMRQGIFNQMQKQQNRRMPAGGMRGSAGRKLW